MTKNGVTVCSNHECPEKTRCLRYYLAKDDCNPWLNAEVLNRETSAARGWDCFWDKEQPNGS